VVFWGFSDSTGESFLNSLEAVYLSDVYVDLKFRMEKGVIINFYN